MLGLGKKDQVLHRLFVLSIILNQPKGLKLVKKVNKAQFLQIVG